MHRSLLEICHDIAFNGQKPAKVVAEELGKPYGTFCRELNPADEGAKLAAEALIPLMNSTGRNDPLEYLAHRRGFRLVKHADREPDAKDMAEECLQGFRAVATFIEKADENIPYTVLSRFLADATKELEDVWIRKRSEQTGAKL